MCAVSAVRIEPQHARHKLNKSPGSRRGRPGKLALSWGELNRRRMSNRGKSTTTCAAILVVSLPTLNAVTRRLGAVCGAVWEPIRALKTTGAEYGRDSLRGCLKLGEGFGGPGTACSTKGQRSIATTTGLACRWACFPCRLTQPLIGLSRAT
ncbi:hypothetical protein NDU88_008719 [Pleurodeles waltl]|uniref:Uncharacterized protein n=1 Tax=Pleurodeles waltl TaxID=8319 RepID=A0AAV7RUL3_PLEWA|nr:hypothetical protein NDU88_008719 [Pleurodeles waltl]